MSEPPPRSLQPSRSPDPPPCWLGTGYAGRPGVLDQQPWSGARVLDVARGCGATGLVLCAGMHPGLLQDLLTAARGQEELPIRALEGAVGAAALGRPALAAAHLGSLDRDESRAALEGLQAALALAAEVGAGLVLVSLGPVRAVDAGWDVLRRRFLRGELLEDDAPATRLMAQRAGAAQAHLGPCLRTLEAALLQAERRGVRLLLRNPRRGVDLPAPLELRLLCEALAGAPLAPALDVPAAHLCSVMRLWPLAETVRSFAPGPLCALGDACGPIGALPVGRGEVQVDRIARALPPQAQRAFLPWPGLSRVEITLGYQSVRQLPAPPPPKEAG